VRSFLQRSLLLATRAFPASALAVPVDFTGAAGQMVAGTGQLAVAELGELTFSAAPTQSLITWNAGFGLGIDCVGSHLCVADELDEIDTFEVLTINFVDGPVLLDDITLSQIFVEGPFGIIVEGGFLFGDRFALQFDAADDGSNDGWLNVAVGRQVEWVKVTAALGWSKDFSLASLNARRIVPTPEPAAMLLFLAGSAVVAVGLRRAAR